jgi:hypothetical protein
MLMVFLISLSLFPNVACLIWLLSPWGRSLERRALLLVGSILPLLGGLLAFPFFADPDGRALALTPVALAYALLVILLGWNLADRGSKAQYVFLLCLGLGTTILLFHVLGWTASCAFGICV